MPRLLGKRINRDAPEQSPEVTLEPAPGATQVIGSGESNHGESSNGSSHGNGKSAAAGKRAAAANGKRAGAGHKPLGILLVDRGFVAEADVDAALTDQAASGRRLGEQLLQAGVLDEERLTEALAEQFGIKVVDLRGVETNPEASNRLDERLARELTALPIREVDGVIEVIVGDPRPGLQERLAKAIGGPVELLAAPMSAARQAIDSAYRVLEDVENLAKAFTAATAGRVDRTRPEELGADAPVAKVVTMLVTQALRDRASDLHVEPTEGKVRIRFRIDGALKDVTDLPESMASPLVSRVKIMSGMNIVERRKAQDGQFAVTVDDREVDVRVSTMATVWGEKCVMRLLDKSQSLRHLHELGMPDDTHTAYSKMVRSPFGMVLCAGPTGSGKTTTLYATLTELDERSRNVVTIEDPVEYVFPTINQVQTNEQAGISFADGLRSILRQDPDIILVGEIRDEATARVAVQAALTGHFVMSSVHATDSVAALHRFLDMGIEAFLLASSLLGVVSQRLVRRNCQYCTKRYKPTPEELAFYQEAGGTKTTFQKGAGCGVCGGTGYQGRIGVYEMLNVTAEIKRLLVGWATQDELRRVAAAQGMRSLLTEGIALVDANATTISEIVRNIYSI